MRKDNLLVKKLKRQFLSINDLIESSFNNLTSFFKKLKKNKLSANSKVFLVCGVSLILALSYFLIPTLFDKDIIQSKIKNHIFDKYNINLKFDKKINYSLLPTPHFLAKEVKIIRDDKNIANVKNLKILISSDKFFSFNEIFVKDIIFNKTDFNINKNDMVFFENLLKIEPNENKIIIKNSNIFFKDNEDQVLFINKINDSKFFYDSKNLQNIFSSNNEIFNLPFKLLIKNDKFNKKIISNFNSKKVRLNIDNETIYGNEIKKGKTNIRFINKSTSFNFEIFKNSLNFFSQNDKNSYKGVIDFKPFYLSADLKYMGLSTKNLLNNDSILVDLLKTEILNNKNLNARINLDLKDITNIDELNNLSLKINIEEGDINFSGSQLMWKNDVKVLFKENLLSYDDNEIKLIGTIQLNFQNLENFYRSLQVKKNYRKKIQTIELDYIYDVEKKQFSFDNIKVDQAENESLKNYVDKFNSTQKRIFNKITFKNFVSNFFSAYAG